MQVYGAHPGSAEQVRVSVWHPEPDRHTLIRYLRFPLQPPHWPTQRHGGHIADAWILGAKTASRTSLMLSTNFVMITFQVRKP